MTKAKEQRCGSNGRPATALTAPHLLQDNQPDGIQTLPEIDSQTQCFHDQTILPTVPSSKAYPLAKSPMMPSPPISRQLLQPSTPISSFMHAQSTLEHSLISVTPPTTPHRTLDFLAPTTSTPPHQIAREPKEVGLSTIIQHQESDSEDQDYPNDPYAFCEEDVVPTTPLSRRLTAKTILTLNPSNTHRTNINLEANRFYKSRPKKPRLQAIRSPKLGRPTKSKDKRWMAKLRGKNAMTAILASIHPTLAV